MQKLPPHSNELEKHLLGMFILSPEARETVALNTTVEVFYSNNHSRLFNDLVALFKESDKFTFDSLQSRFEKKDLDYLLFQCAGKPEIVSGHEAPNIIAEFKELCNKRSIFRLGQRMLHEIDDRTSAEWSSEIQLTMNKLETGKAVIEHISEIIDRNSSEEYYRKMSESCLKTDIKPFDSKIIIKHGDFVIIAGRPSMGKTSMMLYLTKKMALNNQKIGIVSIEMLVENLVDRLALSESRFSGYEGYKDGCVKLSGYPIWINGNENTDITKIKNIIQIMVKKYETDCIFIDYLGLIKGNQKRNKYEEVTELSQEMKWSAKKTGVPHFVLVQLSRKPDDRPNHRPLLGDLRESGALEQDADIVLFCYRPGNYEDNKRRKEFLESKKIDLETYFELIVAKQRNGPTGMIEFHYEPDKYFFAPIIQHKDVSEHPDISFDFPE